MINLNSINLGSLNLGGMNTSEIKLGYPSSGCPIAGLKGLQGLYMGKGLTNEMMSRDPVWRDKSGKGNHIQLKNFGWKLQSGVGMYEHDFSKKWGLFHSANSLLQSTSIVLKSGTGNWGVKIDKGVGNIVNFKAKLIVEGLDKLNDNHLYFGKFDLNPGTLKELHEGLNDLDFDIPSSYGWYGFGFKQTIENANVKITLLPYAYENALCFDGVDDYGICETFPVFTKEKGYTVMALRSWITRGKSLDAFVSNVVTWSVDGAFMVEYRPNNDSYAASFGEITNINSIFSDNPLMYQTSTEYNGKTIKVADRLGTNTLVLGRISKSYSYFSNYALYALAIFDHDTTAEERQPVIDYWKKEFSELFPDQAWTVTGKSNSDADRAVIKNITGNGNDLVLTNFGFAENSGYGMWPFKISKTAAIFKNQPYGTAHFTVDIYGQTIDSNINSTHFKFRVRGIEEGKTFTIRCVTPDAIQVLKAFTVTENGTYEFEYENADVLFIVLFYNGLGNVNTRGDYYVDILQDPYYEGYLVTDGVDDGIKSSDFILPEKYTIVGDWELINNTNDSCGIAKPNQFYIYNRSNGVRIYVNSSNSAFDVLSKSIKAVCSDGRCYDSEWNEISFVPGGAINSGGSLYIGYLATRFTQIAFKNLGIYNNTILNKDQCIRAYNYLQTIKNN